LGRGKARLKAGTTKNKKGRLIYLPIELKTLLSSIPKTALASYSTTTANPSPTTTKPGDVLALTLASLVSFRMISAVLPSATSSALACRKGLDDDYRPQNALGIRPLRHRRRKGFGAGRRTLTTFFTTVVSEERKEPAELTENKE
jgi:hypothetical protein